MKFNNELTDLNLTFPVFKFTLKNGLKILLIEDRTLPITVFFTTFQVGSRFENTDAKIKTGTSHLFEHLMFNGSKKYPKGKFDTLIESCGGYSNAWTSKDQTTFYEVFSPNNIEMILELELDRFNNLVISDEVLESERNVVMEERRLRIDNSMSGKMWELLYQSAYNKHPYCSPVLGWMKDIESITLEDCYYFYNTFYSTNNAIVTLTGDFNTDKIIPKLETAYGNNQPVNIPEFPNQQWKLNRKEKKIEFKKPAELEMVLIGYPGCRGDSPDAPVIDMLMYLLVDGETSRLHKNLVYEKEIILEAFGDFHGGFCRELITFGYRIHPNKKYTKVLKSFDEQIENICNNGITASELEKSRNGLLTSIVEEMSTLADKAGNLIHYESLFGDYKKSFEMIQVYAGITKEDIQRVAQKYIGNNNRTIVHLIPETQDN